MDMKHILVIDDEPYMRSLLIDLVSDLNVQIDEAEDGVAGLERLRRCQYHLVVSDIKMPRMDGIELFENALKENILTPFIFLTGYSDDEKVLKALRMGAADFIAKPFFPIELSNVIVRILELGQRRIELSRELMVSSPHLFKKK
tara:strand:- start:16141 stop:16572 length:432 start_codon:yes stop_codon:yes gene_type:complete